MTPLDGFIHLLSFMAPAFAVALLVAFVGGLLLPRQSQSRSWWAQAAINFAAGLVAFGAGLWYFGVDGKMASYAALIFAVASCQWFCARAWRA
jgi:energy-converting hydrogenase Eha subunit A